MGMGQEGEKHILGAPRPAVYGQTPKVSNRYNGASDHRSLVPQKNCDVHFDGSVSSFALRECMLTI